MTDTAHDRLLILACLALSPRAQAVAGEALTLARALNAEILFVHAGEDTPATRAGVERALLSVAPQGSPLPRYVIREGAPHAVVAEVAGEEEPDLVLAGALEREGLVEGLFGSVARRIVRGVPRSVLLITAPVRQGSPFRDVVVNVAFDDASRAMLEFAIPFLRRAGAAAIHFVYESDTYDRIAGRVRSAESEPDIDEAALMRTSLLVQLRSFVEEFDLTGIEVETLVLDGAEGLETVDHARRTDADLLVFPAPARPLRFWDRFLKHPTEVVMERLPCAILFHRDRADEEEE